VDQQTASQLQSIASSLDDVTDPPPGTVVGLTASGGVEASAHPADVARLTDDAQPRGHGIGLALVREIATAHGGDVRYSETPGGGATFAVRLPAAN
jgi:hypothetical protein